MTTTQTTIRARNALTTKPPASIEPQGERQYLYCIVDTGEAVTLGPVGIGDGTQVLAVEHEGIAALVSATALDKLEISRGNAIAHQRVMETAMQRGQTVLPVRFNTIAEPKPDKTAQQRIIDHVLVGRRDEIRGLMATMKPLVEMGVKGLWTNMEGVFRDIVSASAEIQSCRKKLLGGLFNKTPGKGQANVTMQIKLGEMVKKALEACKLQAENALLERLKPLAVDFRVNKTFGDPMFANLAILIDKSRQDEVADVLSAFEARQGCPSKLRYVGPLPPCNFLELVITWED
jgi:hypothetical protein